MTPADHEPPALADTARQFGAHARQYAVSRAHTEGATRLMLLERMEPVGDEALLDIGSGPGPVAVAFAPYVARAIACDAAPEMLAAARLAARRAEAANLEVVCGDAHRLPFRDGAFGLVTSRACPHHCADIRAAVAEMARVLATGGRLGIADGTVPDDPEIDAFVNRLDPLHDPTTVRHDSAREWRGLGHGAGLRVDFVDESSPSTLTFGAVSNRTYTVQYSPSAAGGPWSNLVHIVSLPTNHVEVVTDPGAAAHRVYRIVTPRQP